MIEHITKAQKMYRMIGLFENKDKGKRFKNETFYYFLFKTFCIIFDPMNCLECGKEVPQTKGRRERLFCNNTCKSKYWRKNKKSDGTVPQRGPGRPPKKNNLEHEILPGPLVMPVVENLPQKAINLTVPDPLKKTSIVRGVSWYVKAISELEFPEEYKTMTQMINTDETLTPQQRKDLLLSMKTSKL